MDTEDGTVTHLIPLCLLSCRIELYAHTFDLRGSRIPPPPSLPLLAMVWRVGPISEPPSFNVQPTELERLPRWRRRIDWLRRAAHAQHPRVLERVIISRYSFDELEQLERAGQRRRWGLERIPGAGHDRGNTCVQRYLAGLRKTAERDLGQRRLAPAVHLLVRGEGYLLPTFAQLQPPAGNGIRYPFRIGLPEEDYNNALPDAMGSLHR
jgi:hypothetical protein